MIAPLRLSEVVAALRTGRVSPLALVEQCLQGTGDAFSFVDAIGARQQAVALMRAPVPSRGPLWGVPVAVKDLVDVVGLRTCAGRASGPIAAHDAPLVARLRELGAVIVGKTHTDELGLGTFTPGVANPYDPRRTAGGSSGGSAAAVASGAAVLAVATDTAGSARIPAAACGVAGLCAASSWFPGGVVGLSDQFDRRGLIAADAASLSIAWHSLSAESTSGPTHTSRIVLLELDALGRVDEPRRLAGHAAAEALGGPSAILEGPRLSAYGASRAIVVTADAAVQHPAEMAQSELVRRQLFDGSRIGAGELAAARTELDNLGRELRRGIGSGVLLLPTLPSPPPLWTDLDSVDDQLAELGRMTRLCAAVNSSGLVSVTVPWTLDSDGHPVSVQVIAASESLALATAVLLQSKAPGGRDEANAYTP